MFSPLLLSRMVAQDAALQRPKDEAIAKADRILGERYTLVPGKPMRLQDKQTDTGPPDAIHFWRGANHGIELVFRPGRVQFRTNRGSAFLERSR